MNNPCWPGRAGRATCLTDKHTWLTGASCKKCGNIPLAYREEKLVIPLIVVIVVVVVDVRPPGIVVREDGEQEEQEH